MARKVPLDSFAIYVSMQGERSYQAIADRFGVSKRAVQKIADREKWGERLRQIEEDIKQRLDKRLGETLEEIRARHLKLARAIGARAAKGLQEYPVANFTEALKAAESSIKLERMLTGEATERTAVTVEQVTRQEIDRLVVPVEVLPPPPDEEDEEGEDAEDADAGDDW
jgi:hypothetical protein